MSDLSTWNLAANSAMDHPPESATLILQVRTAFTSSSVEARHCMHAVQSCQNVTHRIVASAIYASPEAAAAGSSLHTNRCPPCRHASAWQAVSQKRSVLQPAHSRAFLRSPCQSGQRRLLQPWRCAATARASSKRSTCCCSGRGQCGSSAAASRTAHGSRSCWNAARLDLEAGPLASAPAAPDAPPALCPLHCPEAAGCA